MKYSELIKILTSEDAEASIEEWKKDVAKELTYPEGLRIVERFMGVLFTNQLIILSGPPGTGKTSLPFAIAETIKAKCTLIPVQPNWTDNQDLMGYYSPIKNNNKGGYTTTPFLDAVLEACDEKNKDKIYFIVLDEMNLAHIEYYFSTILSIMESKDKTIRLYSDRLRIENLKYDDISDKITFPDNIQIIGTLNMDETTKSISPKVIDRSYILEIPGNVDIEIGNESDRLCESNFDEKKTLVKEWLDIDLSYRLKRQFEEMAKRRFLTEDDYYAGKVLPMIRDKKYKTDIENEFSDLLISEEKLGRMKQSLNNDEKRYDFWGTD